ncbi:cobyrinate a,c-diamide synthase [Poseidonibacter sp. 1_MG-2023]|uniref:cobyrinate a,c-diamide synthase n=1 Tax=Poseidonibacter TaxID=2321187 RepID=UPI0026E1B849|nr:MULTISPECIES: cobyrinate a,c-diamide synthase [Poseidonibacter]MDO6828073.1 cobyrinate a,c-diamide synthase [Poseidonibacter sp. 1_MG-2023]
MSATASNQGKTILTTALLYHYKKSVRPFKIGPDFIDPLFHKKICDTASINLDTCIMDKSQVKWMFHKYSNKDISILEGVMGFYDGMDKGSSAYDVTKLLNIPTVLILDAGGSYTTLSAIIKGLKEYREGNTVKAVVFNHVSSSMHFELIKKQVEKDFDDIVIIGWIKSKLESLDSIHLGLDLNENDKEKLEDISKEVLAHIDLEKLELLAFCDSKNIDTYPFEKIEKYDKHISVVNDENFSFLYHDNLKFLEESFSKVTIINSIKNEVIPSDCDIVFICGGYIETDKAYNKFKNSDDFKDSLIQHSKTKAIYGECAGLILLGRKVDNKKMLGLLPLDFELTSRPNRLGYYDNDLGITGHAFHYTKVLNDIKGEYTLYKKKNEREVYAAFKNENTFGTYFHTMFRNNFNKIKIYFKL